jgi:hypothetical protein
LRTRALVSDYSILDCFISMPSSLKVRTKRKVSPSRRAQLPYRTTRITSVYYNGDRYVIFTANEIKVGEEQEDKVIVGSDETGPSGYMLKK